MFLLFEVSKAAVEVGQHLYFLARDVGELKSVYPFYPCSVHGEVIVVTCFVVFVIWGVVALGTLNVDRVPKGLQNFLESVFEYLTSIARDQLGEYQYRPWFPFVGTIFLFVFVSNWLGALVPWKLIHLYEGEFSSPATDINTTVALSLLTSISYFYAGFKAKGLGFFARYVSPIPIFLPINILEDFSKPLSLSFRLFGNSLADDIVVSVLCLLVPLYIPLPVMFLGIFAGSVQALVFSTLAGAYIFESIE
jgi:F-type H+-transporting ATPase subunit a